MSIEEDDYQETYDWTLVKRFLGYLRPHWKPVAGTFAIAVVGITIELATPFVLRAAVDGPIAAKDPAGLYAYAAVFFALVIGQGISETIGHFVSNLAGQRVIYDLRLELFRHLQRMPVAYYDRNPVGRLLTRVTSDVENLNEMFTSGLVGMLTNIIFLVAVVSAMFVVEWRLTLLTMAITPLIIISARIFRHHARSSFRALRKATAALTAYLNESIGGIKTIQTFNRQRTCSERFEAESADLRDKAIYAGYIYSFFWPGIEFISSSALALLLWQAGKSILAGATSFGTFIAFWYLVRKFFDPIQEVSEKYNILQAAMASSERIFKLLDTPPAIAAPKAPQAPKPRGEIEFRDVHFSYDGKTPVLKGVSFAVRPGETVALVGYTGAGKTSILSLLLRLYDVSSGSILVDGVDVREYDPQDLRRRFGMVFQDVFLFSGSLGDNIRLGSDAGSEDLQRAMSLVNAERIATRLPGGYDAELRERGSAVSTGERQLLSFARALIADPKVLVLDEATSNVDSETEGLIQDALSNILEDRSAVIVAHRLSTIEQADRILVLHKGELREEGTHQELLKRGGLYEKLYRLQWREN